MFFLLMRRRPPRSTRTYTPLPDTPFCQSRRRVRGQGLHLGMVGTGFNLAEEILTRRVDQYIDVGGDSRRDALHQQKVGYREMAFVGWRRKNVGIDQGPEIDGCELAPLEEKFGLLLDIG